MLGVCQPPVVGTIVSRNELQMLGTLYPANVVQARNLNTFKSHLSQFELTYQNFVRCMHYNREYAAHAAACHYLPSMYYQNLHQNQNQKIIINII